MAEENQAMRSWAFMDPWWKILRAHCVRPLYDVAAKGEISGLRVALDRTLSPKSTKQRCRVLRHALELVFLQSVVDRDAFFEALVNHVPDKLKALLKERFPTEGEGFPCHMAAYQIPVSSVGIVILMILTPQILHKRDQAFQATRQQLLAMSGARKIYDKLDITVDLRGVDWRSAAHDLATFVRRAPPPASDYPFRSVVLSLHVETHTISDQLLADVKACLDDPYERVRFEMGISVDQATEAAKCGHVLSALLPSSESPTNRRDEKTVGISLDLTPPSSHHLATQLCSAVMHARNVKSLSLYWTVERLSRRDRTRLIRWMTLSLFSTQASHSIEEVTLQSFSVNEADMDDLETLLQSRNPLGILRGDHDEAEEEVEAKSWSYDPVFLAKDTTLLLNPVGTRPVPRSQWKSVRLTRDAWANVVVDDAADADHCEVLVPGYGLCCIRRIDIQSQRVTNQSRESDHHGVKSLTLSWYRNRRQRTEETITGLCRFLRLVGGSLEALTLSRLENIPSILETIRTACPSLVRLELPEVGSDWLRRLSDAYEAGKCYVSSLVLRRMQRPRGSRDIIEFCEKLCDPELLISQRLTELILEINHFWVDQATDEELAAMVKMLERNTKLAVFSTTGRARRVDELRTLFSPHNNQLLPSQGVPLERSRKLAFLSAVYPRATSGGSETTTSVEPPAISALDSDAIALIFKMAATPVRRRVWVENTG